MMYVRDKSWNVLEGWKISVSKEYDQKERTRISMDAIVGKA
jgi:hypothetical protein